MDSYGDVHRFLVRLVCTRGVITVAETLVLLEKHTGTECDSVDHLLEVINVELGPSEQKIIIRRDDTTNEDALCFVSLADDALARSLHNFSEAELEYYQILFDRIVNAKPRQITETQALNLVGDMKLEFTVTQAEKLLLQLSEMRYFEKEDNNYMLGRRTIHYMLKTIMFRTDKCPNCPIAMHRRCLEGSAKKND